MGCPFGIAPSFSVFSDDGTGSSFGASSSSMIVVDKKSPVLRGFFQCRTSLELGQLLAVPIL